MFDLSSIRPHEKLVVPLTIIFEEPTTLEWSKQEEENDLALYEARLALHHLSLLGGYDELLCLENLPIDHYWYQIETVKKVLKYFRGRVLLADEVGLGKTIEAGMLIKEYMLRGLIHRTLILTPPSLVSQWREELLTKFSIACVTTDDDGFRRHPDWWKSNECIVSSINLAKSPGHYGIVTQLEWDLVVVDEAHHLKNRKSLNWKLVNDLKKHFIFLLTATPVQNNLVELYNLLTLLMPGVLKTEAQFRKEYVAQGNPRMPKNQEKLRTLLREVMIRNTRSVVDVKLPKRFASTVIVHPSAAEDQLYQGISLLVRNHYNEKRGFDRLLLTNLLMRAGSSPLAAAESLQELSERYQLEGTGDLVALAQSIRSSEKGRMLVELLRKSRGKVMVFACYLRTFDYLAQQLREAGLHFVEFRGGMTNLEKNESIRAFSEEVDLLLSTETGGEGRNLQFCQTIINYDLPWNPMRIEQRVGRIHRIGQTKDVFVFNFCVKGSIEEHILHLLHNKINMFELVIGEIGNLLGNLETDEEFSDIVIALWLQSASREDVEKNFGSFADKLLHAKSTYEDGKRLDEALFSEDFET